MSYATVAEADEYLGLYFPDLLSDWEGFEEAYQEAALRVSTDKIDVRYGMCFLGEPFENVPDPQPNLQPRTEYCSVYGITVPAGVIPRAIKEVSILMAIQGLNKSEAGTDITDGRVIKSITRDESDIYSESIVFADDESTRVDDWNDFDMAIAPYLIPGCKPGQMPASKGWGQSGVCLGG